MRLNLYYNPVWLFSFLLSTVLIFSCSPTKFYTYDIQLEKPTPSQNLEFENDTIAVSFTFTQKYIEFEMFNKLEDGMKINWEEIGISINEQAKPVVQYSTSTNEISERRSPITIPPKSKIKDALVRKDMISYAYQDGRKQALSIQNSYPKCDYGNKKVSNWIQHLKGQKIIIYLPFYLKNVYHSKTFEFTVADVKSRT
jgi:hypothetical protein